MTTDQADALQEDIDKYINDLRNVIDLLHRYKRLHDDVKSQHALEIEGVLLRLVEASDSFTAEMYKAAAEAIDATRNLGERRRFLGFLRDY